MMIKSSFFYTAAKQAVKSDKSKIKFVWQFALLSWGVFPVTWVLWASQVIGDDATYALIGISNFITKVVYAQVLIATSILSQVNKTSHMKRWATAADCEAELMEWRDVALMLYTQHRERTDSWATERTDAGSTGSAHHSVCHYITNFH